MDLKQMQKWAGITGRPGLVESVLPPDQMTFGKKLAKKVKATATFDTALSLFERLSGWKVERFVGALLLKGNNLEMVGRKKRGYLPAITKDGYEIDFRTNVVPHLKGVSVFLANASSGAPDREYDVDVLRPALHVVSTAPAHPVDRAVYVTEFEVTDVKDGETYVLRYLYLGNVYLGTNAAKLTSPSGQTFTVYDEPSAPGEFGSAAFYTWAFKSTSLVDDLNVLLGDAVKPKTPEDEDKERIGTLETTGFCSICARRQKMYNLKTKRPLMYDHGYQIPSQALRSGWAPRQNSCFGVGFPPYEVSNEGIEAYIKVLKDAYDKQKAELAQLNANPTNIKRVEGYKNKVVDYTPEHPKWLEVLALEKAQVVKTMKSIEETIQFFQKRKQEWKRVSTYDEKLSGSLFYK